MHHLQNSVE